MHNVGDLEPEYDAAQPKSREKGQARMVSYVFNHFSTDLTDRKLVQIFALRLKHAQIPMSRAGNHILNRPSSLKYVV
jgi:hypothetical protein